MLTYTTSYISSCVLAFLFTFFLPVALHPNENFHLEQIDQLSNSLAELSIQTELNGAFCNLYAIKNEQDNCLMFGCFPDVREFHYYQYSLEYPVFYYHCYLCLANFLYLDDVVVLRCHKNFYPVNQLNSFVHRKCLFKIPRLPENQCCNKELVPLEYTDISLYCFDNNNDQTMKNIAFQFEFLCSNSDNPLFKQSFLKYISDFEFNIRHPRHCTCVHCGRIMKAIEKFPRKPKMPEIRMLINIQGNFVEKVVKDMFFGMARTEKDMRNLLTEYLYSARSPSVFIDNPIAEHVIFGPWRDNSSQLNYERFLLLLNLDSDKFCPTKKFSYSQKILEFCMRCLDIIIKEIPPEGAETLDYYRLFLAFIDRKIFPGIKEFYKQNLCKLNRERLTNVLLAEESLSTPSILKIIMQSECFDPKDPMFAEVVLCNTQEPNRLTRKYRSQFPAALKSILVRQTILFRIDSGETFQGMVFFIKCCLQIYNEEAKDFLKLIVTSLENRKHVLRYNFYTINLNPQQRKKFNNFFRSPLNWTTQNKG